MTSGDLIPAAVRARDLVRYGPTPPAFEWPGGARVAVNLVLVHEGRTAMMTVAMHAGRSGHAARAGAVRQFIAHAQRIPGVAFMRRGDIARWWLQRYPPAPDPAGP